MGATYLRDRHENRLIAAAAVASGAIWQMRDGRAGVFTGLKAAAINDKVNFTTTGKFTVPKTSGVVITDGQPVYWDRSAGTATYAPASDRDFFLGSAVGDAASGATEMVIDLNVWPDYKIDINRGRDSDAAVLALVLTAGTPSLTKVGSSNRFNFSATAEAQKIDILSKQGFTVGSEWIVEGQFTVVDDGDSAAIDFNIGVANGTHASDHDSVTERCGLHLNGNALDLFAMSTDGSTIVAETDTTVNIVLGTPVHFVIDGRDPADIQIYVNGALVLGASVFKLDAATGPLKLLAHLEKSSDDTPGEYYVDFLRVRTAEQ